MKPVMVAVRPSDSFFSFELHASAGVVGSYRMYVGGAAQASGDFGKLGDDGPVTLPIYAQNLIGKRLTIDAYLIGRRSSTVEVEIGLRRGSALPRVDEVFQKRVKFKGRRRSRFTFEIDFVQLGAILGRLDDAAA